MSDGGIPRLEDHDDARAESYRYWQTRPDSEIFKAIWEMSRDAYREWYRAQGIDPAAGRSARSFIRIDRRHK